MPNWYLDEGLARFEREWKAEHPKAVVYKIGDTSHSANPDVSQHAPDRGGSLPGNDKGEVDAVDVMPGNGVTDKDLDDLCENLRKSRDKRIFYVIRRQRIFSSTVSPWEWRPYHGAYHGHAHISVNDNFDNNQSDWKWENVAARKITYVDVPGVKLPLLQFGDEDSAHDGWNHVVRTQALANALQPKNPLDLDGVYGAKTVVKLKNILGGDGKKLTLANMRRLHGV